MSVVLFEKFISSPVTDDVVVDQGLTPPLPPVIVLQPNNPDEEVHVRAFEAELQFVNPAPARVVIVVAPILLLVENRFVEDAVVEKRLVVVAEVVVERPIVTPLTKVVDAVVQIAPNVWSSDKVPVVVIVPPVIPLLVATEVTEPEPFPLKVVQSADDRHPA